MPDITTNLPDLTASNTAINVSITNLQALNSQLLTQITALAAVNPNDPQINLLQAQSNNILSSIATLQTQISNNNIFYQNNLNIATNLNADGITANEMITAQTELSEERLEQIKQEQINKTRSVQINQYYAKKYSAQNEIMKIIIFTCVIVLILWIIDSKQILPIPSSFFGFVIASILTISIITIFFKCYYIVIRNNYDFDEFDLTVNPEKLPPIFPTDPREMNKTETSINTGLTCMNNECCVYPFSFNNYTGYCSLFGMF
jgi:hypothetical protein